MRLWIGLGSFLSVMGLASVVAVAQDVGAATSGSWDSTGTWTTGTIPGSSNNVYIGSTFPSGAAATATVTVAVVDELANNLYLGYGSGTNGTLDLTGHKVIVGNTLAIGKSDGTGGGTGTIVEASGGFFQTKNLEIHNGNTLTLSANDVVTNVLVDTGSTLNLGAARTLTGGILDLRNTGSVVNLNGNGLSASIIYLGFNGGQAVTLTRGGAGGTLTATDLYLANGSLFSLEAADKVTVLHLNNQTTTLGSGVSVGSLLVASGSNATTTESGNVTSGVAVAGGGVLNLGAALNITGQLTVVGTGSTVHMAGNAINADQVLLGSPTTPAGTLDRGGAGGVLNLNTALAVYNGSFDLVAGDKMEALAALKNATVTTAATGNVTVDLEVAGGSTVNLGADLLLNKTDSKFTASEAILVQDSGSKLDAHGHAITADLLQAGQTGTAAVSVVNLGLVTLNTLQVGNGTSLTLHGGDTINDQISLTGNSILNVEQTNGTGLTFNGTSASDLTIDPSQMNLIFTSILPDNWDFRWKDPATGGDWVSTIEAMIAAGQINLTLPPGESYLVANNPNDGYTYIYGVGTAAVPEPSSLLLAGLAVAGLATTTVWRRRRIR